MLQKIFYTVIVTISLNANSIAFAGDKEKIDLLCGGARATIACTKFSDAASGKCIASSLTFDTKDGKHIISHYNAPQDFTAPTIADTLGCATTSEQILFIVNYTPGCNYAQCQYLTIYDLKGNLLAQDSKSYEKVLHSDKVLYSTDITLREISNE